MAHVNGAANLTVIIVNTKQAAAAAERSRATSNLCRTRSMYGTALVTGGGVSRSWTPLRDWRRLLGGITVIIACDCQRRKHRIIAVLSDRSTIACRHDIWRERNVLNNKCKFHILLDAGHTHDYPMASHAVPQCSLYFFIHLVFSVSAFVNFPDV
jgi:hypothetical protein